jgi:hypothetical protein
MTSELERSKLNTETDPEAPVKHKGSIPPPVSRETFKKEEESDGPTLLDSRDASTATELIDELFAKYLRDEGVER